MSQQVTAHFLRDSDRGTYAVVLDTVEPQPDLLRHIEQSLALLIAVKGIMPGTVRKASALLQREERSDQLNRDAVTIFLNSLRGIEVNWIADEVRPEDQTDYGQ